MPNVERPTLESERLILSAIEEKDADCYYDLYVDKDNNKYWGYDYRKDIKKLTKTCFYEMQLKDFKELDNMCLAIREKGKGELIGEVVLHNFKKNKRAEIGVRLFKEYQGLGYGKESVSVVLNYAEKVLGLTVFAKCYKKNLPSKKMLESCGFKVRRVGLKFYHFERV